jgi:signal transduction histidine kinase
MEPPRLFHGLHRRLLSVQRWDLSLLWGRLGIHREWPAVARYGFALIVSGSAIWLRLLMMLEFEYDVLRLLSVIAIALAAWFGGFGPGMLATIVGLAGTFATQAGIPIGVFDVTHGIRLFLAFLTGLIVSGLIEALSRATIAWRRAEEAQEKRVLQERNRMAREIHDTLAQGLTGIIIQIEAAEDILPAASEQPEVHAHLSRARELARVSLAEARRSVSALRPLSLEGRSLAEALSDRLLKMTDGTDVDVALTVEGTPYLLAADCEDNLLRIALEAVTNALKHANASAVRVRLAFNDAITSLTIQDDGSGMSGRQGTGFGLIGMQERAERIGGRFYLSSRPGSGTEISVVVPRGCSTDRTAAKGNQRENQ